MNQINFFQDVAASLDHYLPWLLPVLEGIEHTVPVPARLLICGSLMVWMAFLRRRHAASTATGFHQVLI